MSIPKTIDDRDGSIEYSQGADGRWTQVEDESSFGGTASRTLIKGATAKLTFQGISIQVFGTIKPAGTSSSYSIDGSEPQKFHKDPNPTDSKLFKQLFYTSPQLEDGKHTLIITNLSDNFPLLLDFMVITTSSPSLAPSPPAVLPPPHTSAFPTGTTDITQSPGRPTITASAVAVNQLDPPAKTPAQSIGDSNGIWTTTLITRNGTTVTVSVLYTSATHPDPLSPSSLSDLPAASNLEKNAFPKSAIVGIAVGLTVGMGIIICLIFLWCFRKRRLKSSRLAPRPLLPAPNAPESSPTRFGLQHQTVQATGPARGPLANAEGSGPDAAPACNPAYGEKLHPTFDYKKLAETRSNLLASPAAQDRTRSYPLPLAATSRERDNNHINDVLGPSMLNQRTSLWSPSTIGSTGETDSVDELPPYPGTARWSGKFD